MRHLSNAQEVVDAVVASAYQDSGRFPLLIRLPGEAFQMTKETALAMLGPAKDVLTILDSVTQYVPALTVSEIRSNNPPDAQR